MNKTIRVAFREFCATALTKGFFFGVLVVPAIILALIMLLPVLMTGDPPPVRGTVAVIDRSGEGARGDEPSPVLARLTAAFDPEARAEADRAQREAVLEAAGELPGGAAGGGAAGMALAAMAADLSEVSLEPLAPDADEEAEKAPLLEGGPYDGGRLALVVISPDAVGDGEAGLGAYQFFVRDRLDDRVSDRVRRMVEQAIVRARLETRDLDPAEITMLTSVPRASAVTVTPAGERETHEALAFFAPFAFMLLLMTAVFTGGQYLLSTTIEEKSSRVMEVLLSAVSPIQLMTGKILGQMCVGLTVLLIYFGIGGVLMHRFGLLDLARVENIAFLVAFFFIAFFLFGALLAAIGSAVTDYREAQALQMPVMGALMIPYLLWLPIMRHPNSTFAVVTSYIPPINPFVMVLRMYSSDPPPVWEVLLSILVGIVAMVVAVWAAAKIFRVGVLMYGKPPDFRTLLKWIRMA